MNKKKARKENKMMLMDIMMKGIKYYESMSGDKCMIITATLPNGFIITDQFAVDADGEFDADSIREFLKLKIKNKIMEYIVFFIKTSDMLDINYKFNVNNFDTVELTEKEDTPVDNSNDDKAAPDYVIEDIYKKMSDYLTENNKKGKNLLSIEMYEGYEKLRKKLIKESGYNILLTEKKLFDYMDKVNNKRLKNILNYLF